MWFHGLYLWSKMTISFRRLQVSEDEIMPTLNINAGIFILPQMLRANSHVITSAICVHTVNSLQCEFSFLLPWHFYNMYLIAILYLYCSNVCWTYLLCRQHQMMQQFPSLQYEIPLLKVWRKRLENLIPAAFVINTT